MTGSSVVPPATCSIQEACERLGISRNVAARRGDLPAIKMGKRVLVLREPFERMLRGEKVTS
jgi:excisionase family DNA binding protein